ncbi:MAG TPA: hypothetical protein ENJ53_07360 [Phaeodactylibacter sp.]|nr:hypothetical protein [Phaeodactylibacter sp.]
MKKWFIYFLSVFAVLFIQCKKDKLPERPEGFTCIDESPSDVFTNDCKSNWNCSYELHPSSKLQFEEQEYEDVASIKNGDKLVFRAIWDTEGAANVIDDETTNTLLFEVDSDQTSFALDGEDFGLLNLRYQQLCFCGDVHFKKEMTGCIQGKQLENGDWWVQSNLSVKYNEGGNYSFEVPVIMDALFKE